MYILRYNESIILDFWLDLYKSVYLIRWSWKVKQEFKCIFFIRLMCLVSMGINYVSIQNQHLMCERRKSLIKEKLNLLILDFIEICRYMVIAKNVNRKMSLRSDFRFNKTYLHYYMLKFYVVRYRIEINENLAKICCNGYYFWQLEKKILITDLKN